MKKIGSFLLVIIVLFTFFGCHKSKEEPDTTNQMPTIVDENGWGAPSYENVETAKFDSSKFYKDNNGFMHYNDYTVNTRLGIDVSQFQKDIDWQTVAKQGISFVMLRVGCRGYGPGGQIYFDDKFEEYYEGALNAGLQIGVYFFSQAVSIEEAKAEAEFVIDKIKNKNITYPVAFDWEHVEDSDARTAEITKDQVSDFAETFCDYVKKHNYKSVVYFNCADGYSLINLDRVSDCHFWLAEYASTPTFYYDYQIWQYSDQGIVEGIDGYVDLDISMYDFSSIS